MVLDLCFSYDLFHRKFVFQREKRKWFFVFKVINHFVLKRNTDYEMTKVLRFVLTIFLGSNNNNHIFET